MHNDLKKPALRIILVSYELLPAIGAPKQHAIFPHDDYTLTVSGNCHAEKIASSYALFCFPIRSSITTNDDSTFLTNCNCNSSVGRHGDIRKTLSCSASLTGPMYSSVLANENTPVVADSHSTLTTTRHGYGVQITLNNRQSLQSILLDRMQQPLKPSMGLDSVMRQLQPCSSAGNQEQYRRRHNPRATIAAQGPLSALISRCVHMPLSYAEYENGSDAPCPAGT